jgi:hypothetical protein
MARFADKDAEVRVGSFHDRRVYMWWLPLSHLLLSSLWPGRVNDIDRPGHQRWGVGIWISGCPPI